MLQFNFKLFKKWLWFSVKNNHRDVIFFILFLQFLIKCFNFFNSQTRCTKLFLIEKKVEKLQSIVENSKSLSGSLVLN